MTDLRCLVTGEPCEIEAIGALHPCVCANCAQHRATRRDFGSGTFSNPQPASAPTAGGVWKEGIWKSLARNSLLRSFAELDRKQFFERHGGDPDDTQGGAASAYAKARFDDVIRQSDEAMARAIMGQTVPTDDAPMFVGIDPAFEKDSIGHAVFAARVQSDMARANALRHLNPFLTGGIRVIVDKKLDPKLERERSRDGSCFNLSAAARNKKLLQDSARAYVVKDSHTIICPTHVAKALREQIPEAR